MRLRFFADETCRLAAAGKRGYRRGGCRSLLITKRGCSLVRSIQFSPSRVSDVAPESSLAVSSSHLRPEPVESLLARGRGWGRGLRGAKPDVKRGKGLLTYTASVANRQAWGILSSDTRDALAKTHVAR